MPNFKDIKKGKFFQDNGYYEFNPSHCYMKTGAYEYLNIKIGEYVDVRKRFSEEEISGGCVYKFRVVEVDIKVRRR